MPVPIGISFDKHSLFADLIVPLSLQAIAIVRQLLDAKRPAIALLHDCRSKYSPDMCGY
jgi:hypothetical protein